MPPPEDLEKYEHIQPGFANRLLTLVEQESSHRRESDSCIIKKTIELRETALSRGFIVALVGMALGTGVAVAGHDFAGATIAGIPLATIVGHIMRKHKNN